MINQTQQEQQQTIVLSVPDYVRAIEQVLEELALTPYVVSVDDHIVSIYIDEELTYNFYTNFETGEMKTFLDFLRRGSDEEPMKYFI